MLALVVIPISFISPEPCAIAQDSLACESFGKWTIERASCPQYRQRNWPLTDGISKTLFVSGEDGKEQGLVALEASRTSVFHALKPSPFRRIWLYERLHPQ